MKKAKTIAIAGKGGTGKTIVAALILKWLKENAGGPILALDADPDANLAAVLGVRDVKTVGDLREDVLKDIKNLPAGMSKSAYIEAGLHQVIAEGDKIDLITMGRSEGPDCYCYINNLLREFADKLQSSYDWLIMDNEAGLEHLSRRTASSVHTLLVVVNAGPLSIDCAERINKLVGDLKNDVRFVRVVANRVDEARSEMIKSEIERLNMEYMGFIPYDGKVEECVFRRESLLDAESCPAFEAVEKIMNHIKGDDSDENA